tara:strand:+ start:33 stop:248 length:216 start_codon:yes stop_codon:yes gene_type:complete
MDAGQLVLRQRQVTPVDQKIAGLLDREPELTSVDFKKLAPGPQPTQAKFRQVPRAEYELATPRQVLHDLPD